MELGDNINKLNVAIKILEGIKHFDNLKKLTLESINGYSVYYPEIINRYKRDIEIYNMCIDRLKLRYNNIDHVKL